MPEEVDWEDVYDAGGDAHAAFTVFVQLPMNYSGFHARYTCDCGQTAAFGGWSLTTVMASVLSDWNTHLLVHSND